MLVFNFLMQNNNRIYTDEKTRINIFSLRLPPKCAPVTLEQICMGGEVGTMWRGGRLNQVGHVHRHLLDLCVVEGLNVLESTTIIRGHEVNGDALTTKSTTATDPVYVVLSVGGQVVVDDKRHLLYINTSSE